MYQSLSIRLRAAVTLGLAMTASSVWAQNQPAQPRPTSPAAAPQGRPTAQAMPQMDSILANWLIVECEAEIALAQFAQQRAQETEVKQYSKTVLGEHQEFLAKLQRFAGQSQPARQPANPNLPDQPRDATERTERSNLNQNAPRTEAPAAAARDGNQTAQPPTRPAQPTQPGAAATVAVAPANMGQQIIGLKRELGQQCLATAKKELDQKRGAEFDQCYMHQQVMMHTHAVDTMKVFQSHASGELRQLLSESIDGCQQHLEQAKDLAKKLDGDVNTARREKASETK